MIVKEIIPTVVWSQTFHCDETISYTEGCATVSGTIYLPLSCEGREIVQA